MEGDDDIIALLAHMNEEEKNEYQSLNNSIVKGGSIVLLALVMVVIILSGMLDSYFDKFIQDIIFYVSFGIFIVSSLFLLYNYQQRKKHLELVIYKMRKKYRVYKSEDWKERMPDYKEEKLSRKSINVRKKHKGKGGVNYCDNCGAKLSKGAKFCSECGTKQ